MYMPNRFLARADQGATCSVVSHIVYIVTLTALLSVVFYTVPAQAATTTSTTTDTEIPAPPPTNPTKPQATNTAQMVSSREGGREPFVVNDDSGTAACGSIIEVEMTPGGEEEVKTPIEDCDNPFNADAITNFPATLFIGDSAIEDGDSIALDLSGPHTIRFETDKPAFMQYLQLYSHLGDDRVLVAPSGSSQYVLASGTYSAVVVSEDEPVLTQRNWWGSMLTYLLPTAIAYYPDFADVQVVTFTVTELVDEPQCAANCASSVLFLPGFQASRLYYDSLTGVQQLWEPNFVFEDGDVRKLALDEEGISLNEVFTEDVIDRAGGDAIYQGFMEFLAVQESAGIIAAYDAYAYDWRHDVFDIVADGTPYTHEVRRLQDVFAELAATASSGKVTIIGHSNGGLLGKALIDELARNGQAEQVDQFIMIGTPQLGTPKAVASLLHGTGQGYDVFNDLMPVLRAETVREVGKNMPAAYGLLPGARYLAKQGAPIITFAPGTSTERFVELFGTGIADALALYSFLINEENGRIVVDTLDEAIVANQQILAASRQTRDALDSWLVPDELEVHTIVGTGRNTISGIEYQSFTERICTLKFFCREEELYKPIPRISTSGDQTVMVSSAAWQPTTETERWFIDLEVVRDEGFGSFQHANMTETPAIQQLVGNLLSGATTTVTFVSKDYDTEAEPQVMLGAHSPVYLYIEDMAGQQTGQLGPDTFVEEIPGTEFFTLGESSYLITPADFSYKLFVVAYADGGMTLTQHRISGEDQVEVARIPVTTIASTTIITTSYADGELNDLLVDVENDGELDYRITKGGDVLPEVTTSEPKVSEPAEETVTNGNSVGNRIDRTPAAKVAGATMSTINVATLSLAELDILLTQILSRLYALQLLYE